ncbi:hypothetical protein LZ554_004898 [Drepanopeziza brunnea f. sp. 'monogermtubi']|nr:hypothetical protein LZ554_004898 [Drepanopeziza brunnea f. sp. 'monogermtubi']
MWKRLNNPRAARQPVPEEPALERSYRRSGDNMGLMGGRNTGLQFYDDRSAPPRRSQRDEDPRAKILPRLPFDPPTLEIDRDSEFRPISSIYSQPSPNPISSRYPRESYQTQGSYQTEYVDDEVSPQSSPELRPWDNRNQYSDDDEGVSPIDETPDISRLGFSDSGSSPRPPMSSIPVMRRDDHNKVAITAANLVSGKQTGHGPRGRVAHDPRWDPYSGEITTSDRGKPQSVKPGTFSPPSLRPVHKEAGATLGVETHISAPPQKQNTSFSDRVRKFKGSNPAPVERPPWKGATGRTTLVSPVQDQHHIPHLSIPRKSNNSSASPHSGGMSPATTVRKRSDEISVRTVIERNSRNSPTVQSPKHVTPDPVIVSQSAATRNLTRNENDAPSELERDDTIANIERNFERGIREQLPGVAEQDGETYKQPPSRFSVTTYAPSEAATPRPSKDTFETPLMPDLTPLVNRTRPRYVESPRAPSITSSVVSRKAVANGPSSPVFISMASIPAHLPASKRSSNVAKNLPMSPAEAESQDLVTSLQAQLDDLAHRKNNITRSIRQMTELMPKDSVMLTEDVRRKRELEKIKVERLREEEADVRREEHEVGLKLHRAWKRRDKGAVYEPTGLWVRRVTG